MKKFVVSLIIFLVAVFCINAQDIKFTSAIQKNPVVQGEQFRITFTLYNTQGTRFTPPSFRGFNILTGPSTSQSTQIINGVISQQISYTYILQGVSNGSYTIGPATITVNGNPIKSNSVTVDVVEPSEAEKQNREQVKKQEQSFSEQARDIISKNLFVTLSLSKSNVYMGEQVIATYKIWVNPELNVLNLEPKKEPSFNGFWAQQLDLGNVTWQPDTYKGVRFNSAVIKKVVLLPQQYGKLKIEPYQFDCVARLRVQGQQRKRRGMFDDFFDDPFFSGGSYRDFPYLASSSTEVINVRQLPQPQPDDFNGGVGNISLDAWLDKPVTKSGEPISLKVKISGSGNLKLIEPMDLKFPPDFEVYDPKVADNVLVTATGISGNKVVEYLLIPKHEGEYKIEPVHFSYFDLNKQKYVKLSSKEFIVKVEQGNGGESTIVSGIRKEDIKFLGKDIRYIKSEANLEQGSKQCLGSSSYFILSGMPLFIFIFIILYKKRRDELVSNQKLLKNRQATKIARKRLSAAKKLLSQKERDKFYEEITRALWGYISDKLSIPVSELSKDSARKALMIKKVKDDLIDKYIETIDLSEYARFAPSKIEGGMEKIYEDSVSIISEMEALLK